MFRVLVLAILLFINSLALATNLSWSSFGTLGLTLSDSDIYGYKHHITSDGGVFSGDIDFNELSLIGGQVEFEISNQFDFVGQAILRDMPSSAQWHDNVSLAFFRYSPSSSVVIRAGRITPDLFALSEYRNINVAYPWATVPNEIYGILPLFNIDGADISYAQRIGDATITAKLFTGKSSADLHTNTSVEPVKLNNIVGGALIYDRNNWNIQARYTQAKLANEGNIASELAGTISTIPDSLWPNKASIYDLLKIKDKSASYLSLSGQWFIHQWQLDAELAQANSSADLFPKINAGYISALYAQNNHSWYAIGSFTSSNNYQFNEQGVTTELFPELIFGIESLMNFYASNQQTLSVGWRWDVTPVISTKLQVNRTYIDEWGATLWSGDFDTTAKETVNSLMLTVSYAL